MNFTLLVSIIIGYSGVASAKAMKGRVVSVADGNTLVVADEQNKGQRVRIAGIHAPHPRQSSAKQARTTLSGLARYKEVEVEWNNADPSCLKPGVAESACPLLGKVTSEGKDIGLEMIREGYAWYYPAHGKLIREDDVSSYVSAEKSARRDKKGMWHGKTPSEPWNFKEVSRKKRRRGHRNS